MTAKFIVADVFDGLATLEDGSVDLVVTSPPFLALRSYLPVDHPEKSKEIGSESTPAEFLDVMFRFTAELRRVLAPHGSIAVELGDTYAGSGEGGGDLNGSDIYKAGTRTSMGTERRARAAGGWPLSKSKTLIPELYRIGLAYGINPLTGEESPAGKWRIRNVVTWARPNPPVGALGDKWRPATSDVVVACLSGKRFWDDLATRQPHKPHGGPTYTEKVDHRLDARGVKPYYDTTENPSGAPLLDYWEIPLDGGEAKPYGPKEKPPRTPESREQERLNHIRQNTGSRQDDGGQMYNMGNEAGAPLLDYWEIPPTGYSGSHYAVFPPSLVVPLVQAMCPQKVCLVCGEPSRRIVEKSERYQKLRDAIGDFNQRGNGQGSSGSRSVAVAAGGYDMTAAEYETIGWSDCGHDNWRPGLVLDPFAGSGTTGLVATGFGHDAILIDLDERNAVLAEERIGGFLFERAAI